MTRVLIVDDDPGLRQSLGLLLGESGFAVVAEGDPERGLARAGAEPFDVVLCDIKMPKLDGREFLRRYKAEGGRALVVMMSAHGSEDLAIEAMREGAYDYLHKPFAADSYPGTGHGFLKPGRKGSDTDQVDKAWSNIEKFLHDKLGK